MKHVKHLGLVLSFFATIFFTSGCKKETPESQNQAHSVQMSTGVVLSKWDSVNHRIVMLPKDSIHANINAFFTAYYKSSQIESSAKSIKQYDIIFQTLVPTIAVFNYGQLDNQTMLQVRTFRATQSSPPTPTFCPMPTPPNPTDYPGLRTFTSATTNTQHNDERGVVIVTTPANQYDFSTRLDVLNSGYDYTVDAWTLKSDGNRIFFNPTPGSVPPPHNGVPPPNPPYDPVPGSFTDPKGFTKFFNYWRLQDGAGHETRITIMLEEP